MCALFDDPPTCEELAVYKRASWDFGDALAGVSLEVTERKLAAGRCVNPVTAELIKHRRYVDNLIDSFRSAAEYY